MSSKVTQYRHKHTGHMSTNTTDKINTHRGSTHLEKRFMQTHTDVSTTDKRSYESSLTGRHIHTHRLRHTHAETGRHTQTHTHVHTQAYT